VIGNGHIAGVVDPPSVQKYGFWTNPELPPDPAAWLQAATHRPGSWWPHWKDWNTQHAREQLREGERLDEVVVAASVEPVHPRRCRRARSGAAPGL
jgi:poly(3-hydroxyalkanoate) synthetase